MRHKNSTGEYLTFLAVKYKVAPDILFRTLKSAEKKGRAKCEELSIESRGRIKDKTIFMITAESGLVAQFKLSQEFLQKKRNPLNNYLNSKKTRRLRTKMKKQVHPSSIQELRFGMKNINLKAEVLEVSEQKRVTTRYGNYASIAKAIIADETGKINLCLWNHQVDSVSAGARIKVENAKVSAFRGEKQLSLGRKGTINTIKPLEAEVELVYSPNPQI